MEQVYWLSKAIDPSLKDTRTLVYRYGNYVYQGIVITEPLKGLDYLPGILQGIQAVQGQVPYLGEYKDLVEDSQARKGLRALQVVADTIHQQITAFEPRLSSAAGAKWLEDDDAAIYFEFTARPGHDCFHSDIVFAKSIRGDVIMTVIWYGPGSCYYVALAPSTGEEQSLVDTLFPSIYGKRRGLLLSDFAPPDAPGSGVVATMGSTGSGLRSFSSGTGTSTGGAGRAGFGDTSVYNGDVPWAQAAGLPPDAKGELEGWVLPPYRLFSSASVWEASEPVPDPDVVRDREITESVLLAPHAERIRKAAEAARRAQGYTTSDDEDSEEEEVVDLSGGSGYTQVYLVCKPPAGVTTATTANGLVPRQVVFRFGDWVYTGTVEFPVDDLRLGDVPHVLPALQKQQGRLQFLSEATKVPESFALLPLVRCFMACVSLLTHEMETSQDEVAKLAETGINAWIDEEWSASFFELALSTSAAPGSAFQEMLDQVEMIACKVYLSLGTGLVLHVVYYSGSLYCVLADAVEDLPLLDVAFPDVTARNRVVQVRDYDQAAALRLQNAFGGEELCPAPRCLRVWEGRRKGVSGVGYGAACALADSDAAAVEAKRERARKKAEEEATALASASTVKPKPAATATTTTTTTAAAATSGSGAASASGTGTAGARSAGSGSDSDSKGGDDDDSNGGDDIYDMGTARQTIRMAPARATGTTTTTNFAAVSTGSGGAASSKPATVASASAVASASETKETDDFDPDAVIDGMRGASGAAGGAGGRGRAAHLPSALYNSVARGPHHLAPLQRPAGAVAASGGGGAGALGGAGDASASGFGGNRLVFSDASTGLGGGGAGSLGSGGEGKWEDDDAPWDADGRPKPAKFTKATTGTGKVAGAS